MLSGTKCYANWIGRLQSGSD